MCSPIPRRCLAGREREVSPPARLPAVGPAASGARTDATTAAEAPNGQFAAGLPNQGGAPPAGGGGELSEITVARFEATAFRAMDLTQRQVQGETSLRPLLALVKGQESIPGRKTILYFGTGLKVPPTVEELFRTTISEANRANVSVYAVDARGLHVSGDTAAARTALEQAAASAARQVANDGPVSSADMEAGQQVDDALRMDAQGTMRDLAESTGGLLLANTNDLQPAMERVAADLQGYYELAYAPSSSAYDGRFRKISVKVSRKGVVTAVAQRLLRAASRRRRALPRRAAPGHGPRGPDPAARVRVAGAGSPFRAGPRRTRPGAGLRGAAQGRDPEPPTARRRPSPVGSPCWPW